MFDITDPNRNWGCRVNDQIIWQGYRAVLLQNQSIQIVVLIDKGTEIIQFLYKPLDIDFLWRSPNGLRPEPHFSAPTSSASSPFFDRWGGGWFEVLPNGGPASEVNGASFGFFAETVNVSWNHLILVDDPDQVSVAFWINTYRTPFLLKKALTLKGGIPALFIEEQVTNLGEEPVSFMWGHHPVVGEPFLSEDCRISAPESNVQIFHDEDGPDYRMGLHQSGRWPVIKDRNDKPLDLRIVPPKSGRTMDNCYLKDFETGWIAIQNTKLDLGFGLAWDPDVFRYVWMWQALGGGQGYPWYGRTYCIGIEPWTSYPCSGLEAAIDNRTARTLEPGGSLDSWLTAVAFTGQGDVNHIARDGRVT